MSILEGFKLSASALDTDINDDEIPQPEIQQPITPEQIISVIEERVRFGYTPEGKEYLREAMEKQWKNPVYRQEMSAIASKNLTAR
jgi:hypothetical protein